MDMIGYIYAFISSIFFGLYVVPRKLTNYNPVYFALFVGLGFFVSSTLLYLVETNIFSLNQNLFNPVLLLSVAAGVIWAFSFIALVKSIDYIGLSRSNQWKNLQGPVGVFLSLIILSEYTSTNPIFVVLAAGSIFVSAVLFSINKTTKEVGRTKGITLAVLSALGFGVVTVINKYVTVNSGVYAQQVVWSVSILLTIVIYLLFNKKLLEDLKSISKRDTTLGVLGGFLYLGASFFMLEAYKYIPASIGFTIIQLNALWVVSIGILVFKEIDLKRNWKRIVLGFAFAILGIVFLIFAV